MKNILGIIFTALIITATGHNHVRAVEQTVDIGTTGLRPYIALRTSRNDKVDGSIKRFSKQTVNDKSFDEFCPMLENIKSKINKIESLKEADISMERKCRKILDDISKALIGRGYCSDNSGDSTASETMSPETAALLKAALLQGLEDLKIVAEQTKKQHTTLESIFYNWKATWYDHEPMCDYPTGCIYCKEMVSVNKVSGERDVYYRSIISPQQKAELEERRTWLGAHDHNPPTIGSERYAPYVFVLVIAGMLESSKFENLSEEMELFSGKIDSADTMEKLKAIEEDIIALKTNNPDPTCYWKHSKSSPLLYIKYIPGTVDETLEKGAKIGRDCLCQACKSFHTTYDDVFKKLRRRLDLHKGENLEQYQKVPLGFYGPLDQMNLEKK